MPDLRCNVWRMVIRDEKVVMPTIPNQQKAPRLPIPPVPKFPVTADMEKRCPGIRLWYETWHGQLDDWRKKVSQTIGLPIGEDSNQ